MCAPPLLLTVTPDPTCVLVDVVPDVFAASVAVVPVSVDVDPLAEVEPPPVVVAVDEVEVPSVDSLVDVELAELVDDDSVDAPVVSAPATP